MDKPLIIVGSVTAAMRGRDLLMRRGIRGYIVRVPRTREMGCGYGINVPGAADEAQRILEECGIRVLGRMEERRR